ncbi:MAG: FAD-dependent oxidoreductase [Oscillospiraceae bacterium]|jgi:hypothetical protein|nr:FAD-dependent oxidoreductase [Oscillospiraceae bacterium]
MKNYIVEDRRDTPVSDSCDVLVAGGGIAGIAAAIAAARGGARVTLLEREYGLGGMATLGLVTIYLPLCDGEGNQLIFGIGEELLKLSIEHGAEANYPKAWLDGGTLEERKKYRYITQFNPHLFALRVEKMLVEFGVNILYGSVACGVKKDGAAITHVIVENKSGRSAIEVKSVVDATGDADVCALAGAKTALRPGGNSLASWYYYFTGGKVSLKMFGLADIVLDRDVPPPPSGVSKGGSAYAAMMTQSLDEAVRFSGVDGRELSRAVLAAHSKMYEDILVAKASDPSYVPVTTPSIPLVRMSRRIVGAGAASVADDHKSVADSIGMTGDWRKNGPAFELPYSSLWSREIPNLIAAGRDISVDDDMWDITRVIPPCAVTGEAAGAAASMTEDFASLNVATLQERLSADGVKLHL